MSTHDTAKRFLHLFLSSQAEQALKVEIISLAVKGLKERKELGIYNARHLDRGISMHVQILLTLTNTTATIILSHVPRSSLSQPCVHMVFSMPNCSTAQTIKREDFTGSALINISSTMNGKKKK